MIGTSFLNRHRLTVAGSPRREFTYFGKIDVAFDAARRHR